MTIQDTTRKAGPFAGNGTVTAFPFSFAIFIKSDVKVVLVNTNGVSSALVLDSDYSVSVNSNQATTPGGVIAYPINGSPLPIGYQLVVLGNLPNTQPTDITNSGGFYPEIIEDMSDRSTIQIQQLAENVSRAIVLNESESGSPVLPTPTGRANTILGFDALGNLAVLPITASVGAGDLRDEMGSDGKPGFVAGVDFIAGTTAQLTLSRAPGSISNTFVEFDAAYQGGDQILSLVGTALTFTAPIPPGTQRVYVRTGTTLSLSLPPPGSVSDASLAVGSRVYNRSFFSIDITDYGADRFGVLDSTGALALALAEARNRGGAKVTAPAGKFRMSSKLQYTFPALKSMLGIEGEGQGLTEFAFSSADALQFNYLGRNNAVLLRGLTISTGTVGGGIGLFLNQTSSGIGDPGNSSLNVIDNVEFIGSDGLAASNYWGTGIEVFGVSNINMQDVMVTGNGVTAPYATVGAGLVVSGTSVLPSVVYNLTRCTFNCVNVGINYGNWVQGMSIAQSNFTGNAIGVAVNAGITGLDQLAVAGSQFNCVTGINLLTALENVQLSGTLFIIPNNGAGINAQYAILLMVGQCTFEPSALTGVSNQNGIVVGTTVGAGGVISGNAFFNLFGTGLALSAASANIKYGPNVYANNTTNISDLGANTAVGGG